MGVARMKVACVCVCVGHPGAGNYRPLLALPAGAGTVHLAAAELGRGSGTVLAETTTYQPGPNPQGPEPGWRKQKLDVCTRCQVWCRCVSVGKGIVGTET